MVGSGSNSPATDIDGDGYIDLTRSDYYSGYMVVSFDEPVDLTSFGNNGNYHNLNNVVSFVETTALVAAPLIFKNNILGR